MLLSPTESGVVATRSAQHLGGTARTSRMARGLCDYMDTAGGPVSTANSASHWGRLSSNLSWPMPRVSKAIPEAFRPGEEKWHPGPSGSWAELGKRLEGQRR